MLLITKNGTLDLKNRIIRGEDLEGCVEELKKMIEIKSSHQWRAETAYACVGWALPAHLAWEVRVLEQALWALQDGKTQESAAKLEELINIMDR